MKLLNSTFFIVIKAILYITILLTFTVGAKQSVGQIDSAESEFKQVIANINQTLSKNQQEFKCSKAKLAAFVDETLLPIYSVFTQTHILNLSVHVHIKVPR